MNNLMIQIKRAYEPSSRKDGYRVLIDRLWPRGIKKEDLAMDEWAKDLAPSSALRKDFGHDPAHWKSFVSAYKKELKSPEAKEWIAKLTRHAGKRTLTLLYGARDEEHNNAVVLKEVLEKELAKLKH
jgi:uncharacterized protein YeaO (DUF488 family)